MYTVDDILLVDRFENHTLIFVGFRHSRFTLEIISKDVSSASMSNGRPQPQIHRIIILPTGFVPRIFDCAVLHDFEARSNLQGPLISLVTLGDRSIFLAYKISVVFQNVIVPVDQDKSGSILRSFSLDAGREGSHSPNARVNASQSNKLTSEPNPITEYKVSKLWSCDIDKACHPQGTGASMGGFLMPLLPIRKALSVVLPRRDSFTISSGGILSNHQDRTVLAQAVVNEWVSCTNARFTDRTENLLGGVDVGIVVLDEENTVWVIHPRRRVILLTQKHCADIGVGSFLSLQEHPTDAHTPESHDDDCKDALDYLIIKKFPGDPVSELLMWHPCIIGTNTVCAEVPYMLVPLTGSSSSIKPSMSTISDSVEDADDYTISNSRGKNVESLEGGMQLPRFILVPAPSTETRPYRQYAADNPEIQQQYDILYLFMMAAMELAFHMHSELVRLLKIRKSIPDKAVGAGGAADSSAEVSGRLQLVQQLGARHITMSVSTIRCMMSHQKKNPRCQSKILTQLERFLLSLIYDIADTHKLEKSASTPVTTADSYKFLLRKYRVFMSVICSANENFFLEILSRLCRKIEPEICGYLFPLPVSVVPVGRQRDHDINSVVHCKFESDPCACLMETRFSGNVRAVSSRVNAVTPTTSALELFELALRQGKCVLASRLLTIACESVGGSETNLSRIVTLAMSLELLTASIYDGSYCPSPIVAAQCSDFCLRLESLMLTLLDDKLVPLFERVCSKHVASNKGAFNVHKILKRTALAEAKTLSGVAGNVESQVVSENQSSTEHVGWLATVASFFSGVPAPVDAPAKYAASRAIEQGSGSVSDDRTADGVPQSEVFSIGIAPLDYHAFGQSAENSFCSQIYRHQRDLSVAKYCSQTIKTMMLSLKRLITSKKVVVASALMSTCLASATLVGESLVNHTVYHFAHGTLLDEFDSFPLGSKVTCKRIVHDALSAFHVEKCLSLAAIYQKLAMFVTSAALQNLSQTEMDLLGNGARHFSDVNSRALSKIEFPDSLFWTQRNLPGDFTTTRTTFAMILRSYCLVLLCTGHLLECAVVVATALHCPTVSADVLILHKLLVAYTQRASNATNEFGTRGVVRTEPALDDDLSTAESESLEDPGYVRLHTRRHSPRTQPITEEKRKEILFMIADRLVRVLTYLAPGCGVSFLNNNLHGHISSMLRKSHLRWADNERIVAIVEKEADATLLVQLVESCVSESISGSCAFAVDKLLEVCYTVLHE
jgi:hypothetical protein